MIPQKRNCMRRDMQTIEKQLKMDQSQDFSDDLLTKAVSISIMN
jgi:hypothetical protein